MKKIFLSVALVFVLGNVFSQTFMHGAGITIIGSTMGPHRDYETVMGLVFNGRLRPVIDTISPLSTGPQALQRLQDGDVMGKLVLVP